MNWVLMLTWVSGIFCGGALVGWRLSRHDLKTQVERLVKSEFKVQTTKLESMMRHPAAGAGRATPHTGKRLASVDDTREIPRYRDVPRYHGDGSYGG